MEHFCKLSDGNIVLTVEVVNNDIATNEQAGVDFLNKDYLTGFTSTGLLPPPVVLLPLLLTTGGVQDFTLG